MTTIKELKTGMGDVNISALVKKLGEVREINKYGRTLRVCSVTIGDNTGTIELVLWNENIDLVKAGANIKIENGYVNEWQDAPQLTLGKTGTLTVV